MRLQGRLFALGQAFTTQILRSAYIANLAAWLSKQPSPTQIITGFDSFASQGLPACVRNNSVHLQFMASIYPQIQLTVTGTQTVDVLNAVLNKECFGGMANEARTRSARRSGRLPQHMRRPGALIPCWRCAPALRRSTCAGQCSWET